MVLPIPWQGFSYREIEAEFIYSLHFVGNIDSLAFTIDAEKISGIDTYLD